MSLFDRVVMICATGSILDHECSQSSLKGKISLELLSRRFICPKTVSFASRDQSYLYQTAR